VTTPVEVQQLLRQPLPDGNRQAHAEEQEQGHQRDEAWMILPSPFDFEMPRFGIVDAFRHEGDLLHEWIAAHLVPLAG
jgi:hypothetical protein